MNKVLNPYYRILKYVNKNIDELYAYTQHTEIMRIEENKIRALACIELSINALSNLKEEIEKIE